MSIGHGVSQIVSICIYCPTFIGSYLLARGAYRDQLTLTLPPTLPSLFSSFGHYLITFSSTPSHIHGIIYPRYNFYLPISLVEENMRRSQLQNAAQEQKFWVHNNTYAFLALSMPPHTCTV